MKSYVKILGIAGVLFFLAPVMGARQEREKSEGNAVIDARALAGAARVTLATALDKALKAAPGIAIAAELENEAGQLIFSFDILPSPSATELKEVHVDAKTGLVIKTEIVK